jgi:hypothetical protein
MAYSASGMSLVSAGNSSGPRVWTYETSDAKATVDDADYWADTMARTGDWILCQCSDGGVQLYVSAASSSASTVTKTTPA